VTLSRNADLIDHFRATGKGWQSRMNAALRNATEGQPLAKADAGESD
jgi:uncharacterized protein (DUF4415 family)